MKEFDLGAVTAYALAVKNGFQGTEQEWLTSLVPDLSIGEVKTLDAGSDAAAVMGGTPENPVLNLSLPRGENGHAADWNQNDPAQPDYVQNRTHYEDADGTVVPLPAKYLPESVPYVEGGMVEVLPETNVALDAGGEGVIEAVLVAGEAYIINWNGTEYTCAGQDMSAMMPGAVLVGNGTELGMAGNGEPFVFAYLPSQGTAVVAMEGSTSVTLSIKCSRVTVRKLDNRCLDLAWLPVVNETLLEEVTTAEDGSSSFKSDKVNHYTMPFGTNQVVYFDGERCEVTVGGDGSADNGYYFYCYNDAGTILGIIHLLQAGYMVQSTEGTHTVAFYSSVPNKLPAEFLPDSVESIILHSSTADSTKRFKLTVDDTGAITATEVTD